MAAMHNHRLSMGLSVLLGVGYGLQVYVDEGSTQVALVASVYVAVFALLVFSLLVPLLLVLMQYEKRGSVPMTKGFNYGPSDWCRGQLSKKNQWMGCDEDLLTIPAVLRKHSYCSGGSADLHRDWVDVSTKGTVHVPAYIRKREVRTEADTTDKGEYLDLSQISTA